MTAAPRIKQTPVGSNNNGTANTTANNTNNYNYDTARGPWKRPLSNLQQQQQHRNKSPKRPLASCQSTVIILVVLAATAFATLYLDFLQSYLSYKDISHGNENTMNEANRMDKEPLATLPRTESQPGQRKVVGNERKEEARIDVEDSSAVGKYATSTSRHDSQLLQQLQQLQKREKETEKVSNLNPQEHEQPSWTIFYNIYIHHEMGGRLRAWKIVTEQLTLLGTTYAVKGAAASQPVQLYYNTIGVEWNAEKMQILCQENGLQCHHLQHYSTGNEEVTLHSIWNYCQKKKDNENENEIPASHKVLYMHSKGSYHDNWTNRVWRPYLVKAIASQACLTAPTTRCNACGLQFFPLWAPIFPGNMWTATCEYIRQLVPPEQFRKDMEELIEGNSTITRQFFSNDNIKDDDKKLQMTVYDMQQYHDDKLCLRRYSAECWIASHPALQPCDVSPSNRMDVWSHGNRRFGNDSKYLTDQHFDLQPAPRHDISSTDWFQILPDRLTAVLQNPSARRREYYFLAGHFLKWHAVYGGNENVMTQLLQTSSWVWRFFPDAALWKQKAMEAHGNLTRAVEMVLTEAAAR